MRLQAIVRTAAMAGALALALANAAHADGMPRRTVHGGGPLQYDWTGLYMGASLGYAFAFQSARNIACGTCDQAPGRASLDDDGFVGGVHIGYNLPLARGVIAGVEADLGWTNLDASERDANRNAAGIPVGSGGHAWSRDIGGLATIRGRIGTTITPVTLLYLTLGVAWADIEHFSLNGLTGGCGNCGVVGRSSIQTGFVIGTGVEMALSRHWIARGEYLYYSFAGYTASSSLVNAPGVLASRHSFSDIDIHALRAALSYRF